MAALAACQTFVLASGRMARWILFLLASLLVACGDGLDARARDYVTLALAWNEHDRGYVDAYYGPAVTPPSLGTTTIYERAVALRDGLEDIPGARARRLRRLTASLVGRIDVVEGRIHGFDDESRALIGIVPPKREPPDEILTMGSDSEATEPTRLLVSPEVIASVLEAALVECRERTLSHVDLPAGEHVELELVHGKPWASYHFYLGGYASTVAFNLDYPLYVDRAVDEMCHEAYPGHHVQQVLMERHLVEERGLLEYALLPAYGPVPFVAEGGASYATALVFPDEERLRFERDVLYPLAGLDPSEAEAEAVAQARARRARKAREPLILEAARRNLDGEVDLYNAVLWLERRGVSEPRAALEYAWTVRSHLAAYTYAETLVRRYVESESPRLPFDAWTDLWTEPLFPEEL